MLGLGTALGRQLEGLHLVFNKSFHFVQRHAAFTTPLSLTRRQNQLKGERIYLGSWFQTEAGVLIMMQTEEQRKHLKP